MYIVLIQHKNDFFFLVFLFSGVCSVYISDIQKSFNKNCEITESKLQNIVVTVKQNQHFFNSLRSTKFSLIWCEQAAKMFWYHPNIWNNISEPFLSLAILCHTDACLSMLFGTVIDTDLLHQDDDRKKETNI